jgi:transposase
MDFRNVIISLLGLQQVEVTDIKIFKSDLRVVVYCRQRRDEKACCHRCRSPLGNLHDWYTKTISGPPLGVYQKVVIKLLCFRARCQKCDKNRMAHCPWVHPKHRSMSCGFAETAGRLMEELTCRGVARWFDKSPMQMLRLDQSRMKYMLQFLKIPEAGWSALSADEVHFRTVKLERKNYFSKRWQAEFITNLVCPEEGKVLFNSVGRSQKALENCFEVLSKGQKMAVEWFACDVHDPFMAACRKHLPNAKICVDRFHMVQLLNKAFDVVRKAELKKAEDVFEKSMLMPTRRFVMVSRERTAKENKMLTKLRELNVPIHNAMLLVEKFHMALESKTIPIFRKTLVEWYQLVREAGLTPLRRFAKTIRQYRTEIENYIQSRLTTAVSEGLNNKIKALKRAAGGYKTPHYFRNKILQRCGYLNHLSIPTNHLLFEVPSK